MSPLSCQRCKQTNNGPQAFLLTCRGCSKTWHHRCHMPPVEDEALLQRVRATNAGDAANGLSTWTCRRCRKKGTSETPSAMCSREPTVSSDSHEHRKSSTSNYSPAITTSTSTASVASTVDVRVRQDSRTAVNERLPTSASEAPPHVHTGSSTNERGRDVRPADGAPIQPQDAADAIDDDPDDLYGPQVERRVIRILPSLAQELREQRRVAAEKEKQRAPLAPDWILGKHMDDPLWKEVTVPSEGRKRRKPAARKLGDNGLNVNELIGCFTIQNWVREHKT